MARAPLIHIVCSDRHRNGKTLLARVLIDYLLLDGRDPFVIDANYPEGPLRDFFPGRTALVDFDQMPGRMKLFDTILGSLGRDYVVDLPAQQTKQFFEAVVELGFIQEAHRAGFQCAVLYIVDRGLESLRAAKAVARDVGPDLIIYVRNQQVGSALASEGSAFVINMPAADEKLMEAIRSRRFSLRSFLLGEEAAVPEDLRSPLKSFLYDMMTAFRDIEPAMSFAKLRH